jgi:hypothetical protein
MTTERKHTPTPLVYGYFEDRKLHVIHDMTFLNRHVVYSTNGGLPEHEQKDTMEKMALAFNAHDALVAALQKIAKGTTANGVEVLPAADMVSIANAALASAERSAATPDNVNAERSESATEQVEG